MLIYENQQKKLFWYQKIFFWNFDFKNGWKNEFKDNKENSCFWFRKRVSPKIDFKVVWLRGGHSDSVGVKFNIWLIYLNKHESISVFHAETLSSPVIQRYMLSFFQLPSSIASLPLRVCPSSSGFSVLENFAKIFNENQNFWSFRNIPKQKFNTELILKISYSVSYSAGCL